MNIEYEEPFVKIAGMIGGEPYVKIARALLNNDDATDEEIASATGLKINVVRRVLYDLYDRSLITGVRVRDTKRGWFVYRWRAQRDRVEGFIEAQKRKALERLKLRLSYEQSHEFYECPNGCRRLPFERAMESLFKCPACGSLLRHSDNSKLKEALRRKIEEIEEELSKE